MPRKFRGELDDSHSGRLGHRHEISAAYIREHLSDVIGPYISKYLIPHISKFREYCRLEQHQTIIQPGKKFYNRLHARIVRSTSYYEGDFSVSHRIRKA